MAIGIFNDFTAFSVIRAKLNSMINIIDGTTQASDIQVPVANVVGAGTAAAADTGTAAGNVPTVAQADGRYSAATHVHGVATAGVAGFMSGADKVKLDGVEAGAQVNVGTDLGTSYSALDVAITSSTGLDASLAKVTATTAGVMAAADKVKLDGVQAGAQVNVGTNLSAGYSNVAVGLGSSTGTGINVVAATNALAGVMTAADKAKLDGIAAGAQVNSSRLVFVTSKASAGIVGDGAAHVILSGALELPSPGWVAVLVTVTQVWPDPVLQPADLTQSWTIVLKVNGTTISSAGGLLPGDTVTLTGGIAIAGGVSTVTLEWIAAATGQTRITVTDRNMVIIGDFT